MTDLPGFESEDYMRSWRNYISRIEFELQMIKYPSGGVKSFSTTWNKVAEELMDRKDFGGQIKKGKAVKGIVSQVSGSNDMEHLLQLFEFVKNKMKWDGDVGLVSRKGVKKTWSEGTGNSADINLLLIATLREAGFKVNPIVLSIRKYGMLPISYPTIDNLNYVLAAVELGDQLIFLDATEDHIPAGTIPDRCLNGEAVILAENNIAQPFIMKPNVKYKSIIQNKLTLTEDLSLEGKLIKTKDGKAAAYFRAEYRDADSEEGLIEEMQNGHEGLTIEEHTLENVMNPYEKVKETYQVSIEDKVEEAGDLLYLNPMLYEGMEENPFKLEERKYPVDFIYPIEEIYMFELEIPEGYGIESLPEKVNLALPEKSGQYAYSAKVIGKKITVLSRLKINKPLFVETEYIGLKEFFNLIIKSHAEQIVLKKI